MLESNSIELLLLTIAIAFAFGYILFKLYHFALIFFLKKMNWKLEELKNYQVTPTLKKVDKFIQTAIFVGILWKFLYT